MSKVTFRFFDPIIYAINAIGTHWKKLFLIGMFFLAPIWGCRLLSAYCKPLFYLSDPVYKLYKLADIGVICAHLGLLMIGLFFWWWSIATYGVVSLRIHDNKNFNFNDIFSSLYYAPTIIGIGSIFLLIYAALFSIYIGVIAFESPLIVSLGVISFAIILGFAISLLGSFALWLCIRTLFSTFLIIDKNEGVKKSLISSYRMTKNKFWLLVGVNLLITVLLFVFFAMTNWVCTKGASIIFGNINIDLCFTNPYIDQIIKFITRTGFIISWSWMSMLTNGYLYRKLSESQEAQGVVHE